MFIATPVAFIFKFIYSIIYDADHKKQLYMLNIMGR